MAINRIAYKNALYHVMSRGNNKQLIFCDALDRAEYLRIIYLAKNHFLFRVYAYALMPNHIHLLLETPLANISAAMKFINWTYVTKFNYRHMRSGHLFENRYKAKIIQRDRYFMAAIRYIHLNPVKAGLCAHAEEYMWSSCKAYLMGFDSLTDVPLALESFDADAVRARIMYEGMLKSYHLESEWQMFDQYKNVVIGDKLFKARQIEAKKSGSLQPV